MALGWFQVLSPITAGCMDPQCFLTEAAGSQLLAATSLLITVGWELPLAKAISQPPVPPETKTTARRKICNTMMCIWVLIWHPEEKHQLQRLLGCRCQVMSLAQAYVFLAAEFGLRWPPELGQEGGRHPSATLRKVPYPFSKQPWEVCRWAPAMQDGWGTWARHQDHPGHRVHQDNGVLQHQPAKQTPYAQASGWSAWGTSLTCTHR